MLIYESKKAEFKHLIKMHIQAACDHAKVHTQQQM